MLKKLKCCAVGCAAAGVVVCTYWLGGGEFERGTALGVVFVVSCVLGFLAPVAVAAVVEP
jgi:uncharacterized membrane protein YciS (DUF1049 family)